MDLIDHTNLITDRDRDAGQSGFTLDDLGVAIQVWSFIQERSTTIAEASRVFRCTEALVRDAVEQHPWMFLSPAGAGDLLIEHEGE